MKLDNNNKNNPIYYNLKDKTRFNLKTIANNKKNEDKIKSKNIIDPSRFKLIYFNIPYQCYL